MLKSDSWKQKAEEEQQGQVQGVRNWQAELRYN